MDSSDNFRNYNNVWLFDKSERSIFQTFWKPDCCPDFLFLELETSNFGYLLIFWFTVTVQSFRKIGHYWCNIFHKGSPFDVFWFCNLPKIQRGDPYKMCKINVVQTCWNFAHSKKIKKYACSQNLKSLTQKTKIWWHNAVSGRFGKYSF